jgi:hypothetical protein
MMMRWKSSLLAAAFAMSGTSAAMFAQSPPGTGLTAKAAAPIDLTGYWVSVVTEDWRYRMLTAPKGDYYSIPLTPEARKVADTWDAARDVAQGKQCMAYGAPAIMRQPSRVQVAWDSENTLKVEIDAGKQTRIFAFGAPRQSAGEPTMQGSSIAQWQSPQITRFYTSKISAQDPDTPGFRGQTPAGSAPPDTRKLGGTLKVVTTHLKPGYLRNNGVPYSANAVLTEYYDIHQDAGQEYMVITSIVEDPQYLYVPWVVSNQFRREPDGSKWKLHDCELILSSK